MLKQFKYKFSSSTGFFMLLVYAIAAYGSLFHSHETTSHVHNHGHEISLEDHILLSSACHNSIYHNITSGCGHSEHVSKSDDKCFTCEFFLSKKAIAAKEDFNFKVSFASSKCVPGYSFFYSKDFTLLKPNRGPPVFVS